MKKNSKANFCVDSDFPLIDGIGHSDKVGWANVKGGGSTNTTFYDPTHSGEIHFFRAWRNRLAVSSGLANGDYDGCTVPPALYGGGSITGEALNVIPVGDDIYTRASDRVCLRRCIVQGSLLRPAGLAESITSSPPGLNTVLPKVFVALVLDSQSSGTVANPTTFHANQVFEPGLFLNHSPGQYTSSAPLLRYDYEHRYRVLCHDIIDFAESLDAQASVVVNNTIWSTVGVPGTPDGTTTVNYVATDYIWKECTRGFRFDVDLNDVLCSFKSNDNSSAACLADIGLYVVAILFDGVSKMGYVPVAGALNYVDIEYGSALYFYDYLSATVPHVAAGADGPVVPPADDDFDVLADESAKLAGLPPLPESPMSKHKRRKKGDYGFYNFRPRNDDVLMEFPDDPEVAVLAPPGSRGSTKGPYRKKVRRFGRYYGPPLPGDFELYWGDEFQSRDKRGKF